MAELHVSELVDELVRLETELTVIRSDIDALYELLADQHGTDSSGPARTEPRNVLEATELASRLAVELGAPVVFAKRAFKSARRSQFARPGEVLRLLELLIDAAVAWKSGTLPSWKDALGADYRADVSTTALGLFPSDYNIQHDGFAYQLGPHFRVGTGPPNRILRIYWALDPSSRTIVVGHVGRKLRDTSNS